MEHVMKSETASPACACASNPVARALAAAAVASSTGPSNFHDELDWHIRQAKHTAGFLVDVFSQADLHRSIDFLPEHLHGVTVLLANELQTIECLHTALHEVLNEGARS
jgi:hypothetical protein